MDRLANGADRLREGFDRMFRRYVAGVEMHLCDAQVVARDETVENFGEEAPLLRTQPPHDAEVYGSELAVVVDEQVARMHVGMEKAVAHGVAQERLNDDLSELRQVVAFRGERAAIRQRRAVDPFERQHVLRGEIPVHRRHAEIGIVLGVLRHFGERGGL